MIAAGQAEPYVSLLLDREFAVACEQDFALRLGVERGQAPWGVPTRPSAMASKSACRTAKRLAAGITSTGIGNGPSGVSPELCIDVLDGHRAGVERLQEAGGHLVREPGEAVLMPDAHGVIGIAADGRGRLLRVNVWRALDRGTE